MTHSRIKAIVDAICKHDDVVSFSTSAVNVVVWPSAGNLFDKCWKETQGSVSTLMNVIYEPNGELPDGFTLNRWCDCATDTIKHNRSRHIRIAFAEKPCPLNICDGSRFVPFHKEDFDQ